MPINFKALRTRMTAERRGRMTADHRRQSALVDRRTSALRGQTTLEYAVVIAVVAAALLSMQIYMKRGFQGRYRSATDQVGEQFVPTKTTSTYTVTSSSDRHDVALIDGSSTSTLNRAETQTRSGSETVDTSGQTKLF